jgi:F-type H+-transporting ATPase subunit gamma
MPSLKDIRNRIASVKSTQQITKAMKMVSGAKMRRAHAAAVAARPYAAKVEELMSRVAAASTEVSHPLLQRPDARRAVIVVVTSDRGLCGGFNHQLLRKIEAEIRSAAEWHHQLVAVGRKGRDYLRKRGYDVIDSHVEMGGKFTAEFVRELVARPIEWFANGDIGRVALAFNAFRSALSQVATFEEVLPVPLPETAAEEPVPGAAEYLFEPNAAAVLAALLPRYVESRVLHALLESEVSEHSARMTAMDAATNNADELIRHLTLTMNRARQAMITKELLDIVGGAEALSA